MIKISVDLMGGDNSPHAILEAIQDFSNVHFLLHGLESVKIEIKNYKIISYDFFSCDIAINDNEKFGIREIEASSMYSAIDAVAKGAADAVVSGGSSGYYLLLCKRVLGLLESISRPALTTAIPTLKKPIIMMDLGANLSCSETDLVKFGMMGHSLARFWLDYENPNVKFVNVGEELGKGPALVRDAASQLSDTMPDVETGFVEPNFILDGDAHVVVTDGFTGNCLLKMSEGVAGFFRKSLKKAFLSSFLGRVLGYFAKNLLKENLVDPRDFNGAIWAGVNGCAIKSHGGSDAVAVRSAIKFAIKIAKKKDSLLNTLKSDLSKIL